MMNDKKLLTPTDVANRLQVNERTVTLWRVRPVNPTYRVWENRLPLLLADDGTSVSGMRPRTAISPAARANWFSIP